MAGSRSASLPALTTINSFPIARAAFGIRCNVTPTLGLFKLTRKPITDAFGTSWLSSSSRFPPRSNPGHVATGPVETCDQAKFDGVATNACEYHWN
jgi:hypothetical protein